MKEEIVDVAELGTQVLGSKQMVSYKGLLDLVGEINGCEQAGATIGGLAVSFVCVDSMSYLSMPADKRKHDRSDFIACKD